MASDAEWRALLLLATDLLTKVHGFVKEVVVVNANWDALQWSNQGPHTLFEEFRRVGGWADSIISRTLDFEQEKNGITCAFKNLKAQVEIRVEKILRDSAKSWVDQKFAYQERQAMARIDAGDEVFRMTSIEMMLQDIDGMLGILKAKSQQLVAFKNDARAATSLMNFGHQLGELK